MRNRTRLAITLAACAMTSAPLAAADPGTAPAPVPDKLDLSRYNEWNIPKDIYVPGDPFIMISQNMNNGSHINFVTCPILIDSEPTPLWIANYKGERYFLRAQQNTTADVHSPELGHQVLVEGIASNEPRIAGGMVLSPLRLSVMRELDPDCNVRLPMIPGYKVAHAKRPPGPGTGGNSRETVNNTYADAGLAAVDYKPQPVAHEVKTFVVRFDFDSDVTWDYYPIKAAITFAKNVRASSVEIIGYKGAVLLDGGGTLVERPNVNNVRAKKVADIFADFNVSSPLHVETRDLISAPDGISDFLRRRVDIIVRP